MGSQGSVGLKNPQVLVVVATELAGEFLDG
jgi:hypothetical protein